LDARAIDTCIFHAARAAIALGRAPRRSARRHKVPSSQLHHDYAATEPAAELTAKALAEPAAAEPAAAEPAAAEPAAEPAESHRLHTLGKPRARTALADSGAAHASCGRAPTATTSALLLVRGGALATARARRRRRVRAQPSSVSR
jgi:hypothetical protein